MYAFDYLRFNFRTRDFVMKLPIKAQITERDAIGAPRTLA